MRKFLVTSASLGLATFCSIALASGTTSITETTSSTEPTMQPTTTATSTVDAAKQNQQASDAYLANNAKQKGIVAMPSGLQYKIVEAGTGKKPTNDDVVTVDYEGQLIDGTIFDSSYKRGMPATFPVAGVIPGWQEALQMMPVGSTWMLYIPSSLAYGSQGAPGVIGPNQALVFKVHLIAIK